MKSGHILGYACVKCGAEFPAEPFICLCRQCGNNLDVVHDYDGIRKTWSKEILKKDGDSSIWRYLPLMPVAAPPADRSIRVGGTPLVTPPGLSDLYPTCRLHFKDDTRNPSGSLKDRATEIAIRHAAERGGDTLVAASTGNAGSSLAILAAFHRKRAIILAPGAAPEAKLVQILQAGARLCLIKGTYDEAFDLVKAMVDNFGWYSRNTGTNPVLTEGKKTVALEIAEQLHWEVPDFVFVPVGDGSIIGGVHKGFRDLLALGWIDRLPRIIAVQATGSKAIVAALDSDQEIRAVKAKTIADSIAVDLPRDGLKALKAVRASNGFGIVVSDDEILRAQHKLASRGGLFAEPAAAAAFAGFHTAFEAGRIPDNSVAVILLTGSGLKDIPSARKKITLPDPILPDSDSVRNQLRDLFG